MQTVLEVQPLVRLVLYIEDNISNIESVQELLSRRRDVALMYSRTGLDGIAMAVAHKPAVILLDLHLRDITGVDALSLAEQPRDHQYSSYGAIVQRVAKTDSFWVRCWVLQVRIETLPTWQLFKRARKLPRQFAIAGELGN